MIYLVVDKERKYCKIGFSTNPKERVKALQTGSPLELELIALRIGGLRKDELILHKKYKPLHLRYEWYSYDEIMLEDFPDKDYSIEDMVRNKYGSDSKELKIYLRNRKL